LEERRAARKSTSAKQIAQKEWKKGTHIVLAPVGAAVAAGVSVLIHAWTWVSSATVASIILVEFSINRTKCRRTLAGGILPKWVQITRALFQLIDYF
jgi:hypothetical protein